MLQPCPDIASLNSYRSVKLGTPNCLRLSNDIERSDVMRIRSVVADFGFLNAAVSRFVKHLYEYTTANNLSFTDRERLISYVATICPVPVGPTPSRPLSGNGPADTRRPTTAPVGPDAKGTPHIKRPRARKQAATNVVRTEGGQQNPSSQQLADGHA
jgi:hypothetical protein